WDVDTDGLWGAPRVRVLVGERRHDTIDRALRCLGMGAGSIVAVPIDEQGRMTVPALPTALARSDGPMIVCAQAGNVNTGAIDPIGEICDVAHQAGAWVHVDAAFGMWGTGGRRGGP